MNHTIIETLRSAGKESLPLTLSDGSEVLVLPYGGRVLGLFTPGDSRNFFWTNPALADAESARAFYSSDKWTNSGGDRTWLAPEIEFFLPNYPKLDSYFQQRSLDPGSYVAEVFPSEIRLKMDFNMTAKSVGQAVKLRVTKTLSSAPDPLKSSGVQYAGYQLGTVLEGRESLPISIGIWNLLQLPFGGEMIIPTYGACQPLIVFGQPESHLKLEDNEVRFQMTAKADHKISLPALFSTGRVGYLYEDGKHTQLIVRNFFVNPSGDYVDANWNDASDTGYCVQACSLNGTHGMFSELEYHAPAINAQQPQYTDTSQVWAYRGSRQQMNKIAQRLLGTSI